jgi:hypothetical protein
LSRAGRKTQKAQGKAGWLLTWAFWGRMNAASKGPSFRSTDKLCFNFLLENLFVLFDPGNSALTEIDLDETGKTPVLQLAHQFDESFLFFDHMAPSPHSPGTNPELQTIDSQGLNEDRPTDINIRRPIFVTTQCLPLSRHGRRRCFRRHP